MSAKLEKPLTANINSGAGSTGTPLAVPQSTSLSAIQDAQQSVQQPAAQPCSQPASQAASSPASQIALVDEMLLTMAQDLGLQRFIGESDVSFVQRVLYSGLSCWLKTLTVNVDASELGVERKLKALVTRNLTQLLNEFLLRYPEALPYFIKDSAGLTSGANSNLAPAASGLSQGSVGLYPNSSSALAEPSVSSASLVAPDNVSSSVSVASISASASNSTSTPASTLNSNSTSDVALTIAQTKESAALGDESGAEPGVAIGVEAGSKSGNQPESKTEFASGKLEGETENALVEDEQSAEAELEREINSALDDEKQMLDDFELESPLTQNIPIDHTTSWLLRSRLLRLKDIISPDNLGLTLAALGTEQLTAQLMLLRGCLLEKDAFYSGVACLTHNLQLAAPQSLTAPKESLDSMEAWGKHTPHASLEADNWNFLSDRAGSWEQLFFAVKGGVFTQPEDWLESYLAHALWVDGACSRGADPTLAAYSSYLYHLQPLEVQQNTVMPEWMEQIDIEGLHLKFFNTTLADKVRIERLWDSHYPRFAQGELSVVLCKTCESLRENERYFLWHQPTGRFHMLSEPACQAQEYYRLMFALLRKAGHQVMAKVQENQDYVQVHLPSRLPELESRLLETMAWPVRSVRDLYCWQMSTEVWDFVSPYLQALGLQWR